MAKICDVSWFFWLPVLLFFVSSPPSPVQGVHPQTLSCFLETFIFFFLFTFSPVQAIYPTFAFICLRTECLRVAWFSSAFPSLICTGVLRVFANSFAIQLLYSFIFVMAFTQAIIFTSFLLTEGLSAGDLPTQHPAKKRAFHLFSVVFGSKARLFGLAVSSKRLFPFELWWFKIVCLAYPRKMIV